MDNVLKTPKVKVYLEGKQLSSVSEVTITAKKDMIPLFATVTLNDGNVYECFVEKLDGASWYFVEAKMQVQSESYDNVIKFKPEGEDN